MSNNGSTQKNPRSENITALELLNMLIKTDHEHHGLSDTEKSTLATLITFINGVGVATNNVYEAFPSGDLIIKRTGYSIRTIENNRKTLKEKGWLKIVTGKGKGNANHYFIDAQKIILAYNLSNPRNMLDINIGNPFNAVKSVPSKTIRNTTGLMKQGVHKPKRLQMPKLGCEADEEGVPF